MAGQRASWQDMPMEIQEMVLKQVKSYEPGFGRLASVCRAWQPLIESINFSHLKLTDRCLVGLDRAITQRGRARLVKYIQLCVILPSYDCSKCGEWQAYLDTISESVIVIRAVESLLSTLRSWELVGKGITLDLNIRSCSDSEHHWKKLIFDDFNVPSLAATSSTDKEDHGWMAGGRVDKPPYAAYDRLYHSVDIDTADWKDTFEIPAVTGLLLRRQTRRRLNPADIASLVSRFPMLDTMNYEPWRQWSVRWQEETDVSRVALAKSLIPTNVRNLILFEDFDESQSSFCQAGPEGRNIALHRLANADFCGAIAHASRGVEHLSASFLVDARHFFAASQPHWQWKKLKALALTSPVLVPAPNGAEPINQLLCQAAAAVQQMPELALMELWNYEAGAAAMFRYHTSTLVGGERVGTMTWRGNWALPLERDTEQAWQEASRQLGLVQLLGQYDFIQPGVTIKSVGAAIHHLKLACTVVHATSLWQMRTEDLPW